MACNTPAHLNKSNHGHMLFVGGIPYDMKQEEFQREIQQWKGVCDQYYGGATKGWGSVTFDTLANRNLFLNDKRKHVIGKKIVDVKPYGKPKEDIKPGSGLGLGSMTLTAPASSILNNSVLSKPVPMNIAPEPVPLPPIPTPIAKSEPNITVLEQALANCQTGAILRYISPNFGLLRTPKHGNGVFHADAVYLCSQHNLACKTVNCPDYTEFTSTSGTKKRGSIFASLPVGTQVNFLGRPIMRASFPDIEFKFQATLVWPQLSKKPSSVAKPQDYTLDDQLRKFLLLEQRFVEDQESTLYLSKKMQIANAVDADDQISLDDDSDFDEDLNLGELDNVLDQMSAIKSFLRNIGFSNELPLLRLANRLMAIKDEEKAIEAIMQCLEESRIRTDENKRASIIANFRTLQHTLRRGKISGMQGSPTTIPNNAGASKSTSMNSQPSNNMNNNINYQGFSQTDIIQDRATTSVISRPPPGFRSTNNAHMSPVTYDDELLEEKFESYFFKKTRSSEFSWIEKDETVKKQCKVVTLLWKDVGYTISKLAMEYEIYTDLPASDDPRNVLVTKWSEKLKGKNGNNRVLMYNEKIAAVTMDFFDTRAHYKCVGSRNVDPHFELRKYFEMFANTHSMIKGGQQPHPHSNHLKKALRSLKMDTNIIQLAYEAFNDSCDPSRSSMTEKLPGWRATLQNLLEKHENFKGSIPAQACDHIFIYLETRNFTNKPILSDSDDGNDNEQYNLGATPPQGTAPSNSDSKEEFDRNSLISDSISVASSLNNGVGGIRNSRSSSLDPASKQVGNKKLPAKRMAIKDTRSNSLTSSSNKDTVVDGTDNLFNSETFVAVNLKSCGNTFKTCPSNDSTTAAVVAKLVDAGGEYHPYQHFIKWLKDNYKVIQKEGHPIENAGLYIRTIVDAWIKAEKPISELKEEFRKGFGEPTILYSDWARCVETTMDSPVTASVDAVIKTTFQYCWEALTLPRASMAAETNDQVLQLFRNISYKTDDGFYHTRGVVIKHFSEDFGLIQTKFGKVLYERNIAYTMKSDSALGNAAQPNGSNWRRCKNSNLIFNKHVMVKLHIRVGKFRVKKKEVKYLYATKVWLSFPSSIYSEPSSGVCILGRDGYWKEVHLEFEKIVKANSSIRFHIEQLESKNDYRQAYSTALKYRHKLLLLTHGIGNVDKIPPTDKSFDQLIYYIENGPHLLDPIHRDEVISTIRQLSTRNINFLDIRKAGLLHTLINTIDCFEADIELMLLCNMRSNDNDSKAFITPNVCDIIPFIMEFLSQNDLLFKDQLVEQQKFFQKEKKGSLSQLENIINIINRLYVIETPPPLSVLLPPSEDILTQQQERPGRQAGNSSEPIDDDNLDDIEVDFESEPGNDLPNQREQEISDLSGAASLISNGYRSKDNVNLISNGSLLQSSLQIEELAVQSHAAIDSNNAYATSMFNNDNGVKSIINDLDINSLNFEESEQFSIMQERIKELESWKEQRVKEDNAFKDTINLTFTKVLDKLVELDQNYQVLKAQQATPQTNNSTNTHRLRNFQKSFIKITATDGQEIHEFPADEDGNLSATSVNAVYPGVSALKYKSLETGTIRLCSKNGDMFEPPEDGWGNRLYFANITGNHIGSGPSTLPVSNSFGLSSQASIQVPPQTQQTPTFRGQAPFPQYNSMANIFTNPVSVSGLRAANNLQPQLGLSNNTNSNSFFGPLINGTSYKLDT